MKIFKWFKIKTWLLYRIRRNQLRTSLLCCHICSYCITLLFFQWLRQNGLALSENKFQSTYLAELLASIAYTRGRLMFYKEFDGDREEHINYLKLSYYITKEVSYFVFYVCLYMLIIFLHSSKLQIFCNYVTICFQAS